MLRRSRRIKLPSTVADSEGERHIWPPSEAAKRDHLLQLFQERQLEIFIESGTYLGDTVEFFLPHSRRIVSVEIEPGLYHRAAERFAASSTVELLLGDSTTRIPKILKDLGEPFLLWLDGHYSNGITGMGEVVEPALGILERIGVLDLHNGFTIAIDDLRLFGSERRWPSLETLIMSARKAFPTAQMCVELDALVVRG